MVERIRFESVELVNAPCLVLVTLQIPFGKRFDGAAGASVTFVATYGIEIVADNLYGSNSCTVDATDSIYSLDGFVERSFG